MSTHTYHCIACGNPTPASVYLPRLGRCVTCDALYKNEHIRRIRRRVEDALRKATYEVVLSVAHTLKVKLD